MTSFITKYIKNLDRTYKGGKPNMPIKHTSRGLKQDGRLRSKQNWERGRGAVRKGNPRYKPVKRSGRKVYILRPRK